jgi:hypothetical protein
LVFRVALLRKSENTEMILGALGGLLPLYATTPEENQLWWSKYFFLEPLKLNMVVFLLKILPKEKI